MPSNDTQTAYWQKQLANAVPLTGLPVDKERPPVCSFLRGNASLRMDSQARQAVGALADREQTSAFAVLLAAFQAVLFRYTGQTDLVTCAAHTSAGKGPYFLRTHVSDAIKATDLVRQVAGELTDALAHNGCGFDALLGLLDGDSEFPGKSAGNTAFLFTDAGSTESRVESSPDGCFPNYLAQCDFVVSARHEPAGLALECDYDAELFEPSTIERLLDHFQNLLLGMVSKPELPVAVLPLMGPAELQQLTLHWNNTAAEFPRTLCIHEVFEAAAARIPNSIALICGAAQLTYGELNARANQLAAHLRGLGVGPETIVGIGTERSLEMVVGLLGILKAGGAYLPLDPDYPRDRLAFMLADSKASVLLTDACLRDAWGEHPAKVICLDTDWDGIGQGPVANIASGVKAENLAYVIYTSGSTGKPKGVMVTHRNVVNFFTGMDRAIGGEPPGTWLSVTSISFDISVLEIFWTLTRDFKVVLYAGDGSHQLLSKPAMHPATKPMDFSLFYFSASQDEDPDRRYHLLTEGARFADEHGFSAVWTPERHFHKFGGLYPNPALTSAAIAMITRNVQIRSGSVVAPLHTPIRIAEEWAVVDNLSNGRAAISFASGWMPEDFVLRPESYASRKEGMFRDIEIVRKLWRGESVAFPGPLGEEVAVRILPRPIRPELPVWVTAAGNPETFRMAGQIGANVLTHLLGQSVEEVAEKVAIYRRAWQAAGHPGQGHVTLMLHTFVSEDLDSVRETVRQPLIEYLRTSADLIKNYSWAFSAFKGQAKPGANLNFAELPKAELDAILAHAFERYFETSGLFGTPASCLQRIDSLAAMGVDEVACLIDFGVSSDLVLKSLSHLNSLREAVRVRQGSAKAQASVAGLIRQHQVTHLQCTPSMARMLMLDDAAREALQVLRQLMIGGEAFPVSLAAELRRVFKGDIINMYGPTETTIWSTTCRLNGTQAGVPIGRPIANTETYIVDRNLQPVPVGIPGELMIGGAGVVRGYLNRPELTAERFCKNPFRSEPDARLYRTGDLARFLPDGNIEFIGRLDTQVKIRGYRIELGEIETLLNTHPAVGQSVVVAREDVPGEKQLVAYVVYRNGHAPDAVQLREYVREKLPEHMVPARVVSLSAFPLTPNNKIDRKALPSPQQLKTEPEPNYEAPSSPLEEALAELWCETLRVSRVGRNEDFFELGGDSLSAVQVLFQIRQVCSVGLPMETLFHSPTLAGLAGKLEEALLAQAGSSGRLLPPEPGASQPSKSHGSEVNVVLEPPQTPIEKALAGIWASILGDQKISRQDDFFQLGGTSLLAMNLFLEIETEFRKKLPLSTLFRARTLEQLACEIENYEDASQHWSSLVAIQPRGDKRPFFCVHAAGGNVLLYGELARTLGTDQPFYGLQCQGLDGKQDYLTSIEEMAAHYLREVRSLQPAGPYSLGGFCMGGMIAYEMAQQLERDGQQTAFLGLFDTYNCSDLQLPHSLRERLSHTAQKIKFHWSNLVRLGARDRFAYFTEKFRIARKRELARISVKLANFSKKLNPMGNDKRIEVFLEDFNEKVGFAYRPKAYRGRATIFRPRQNYALYRDPQLGWGHLITGGLEIIDLPVNPGGMFAQPYVQELAAKLSERLNNAAKLPSAEQNTVAA